MNKTRTYYQPEWYADDGTNIEYGDIPEELNSFEAFADEETCRDWLSEHDYDPDDFAIIEYHDDDIEGVTIIDEFGDILETNEDDDPREIAKSIIDEWRALDIERMAVADARDELANLCDKMAEFIQAREGL